MERHRVSRKIVRRNCCICRVGEALNRELGFKSETNNLEFYMKSGLKSRTNRARRYATIRAASRKNRAATNGP